jgi:uncharacterized protein YidB (DUF937 family)
MGLLDELGNSLEGAAGQVLGQALNQVEANAVPALLQQMMGKTDLGSVAALLQKLQQGNLGGQVSSWLGNGPNQPITPEEIREALGNQQVQQMAKAMGLPVDQILAFLAKYLPDAVNQMSPNGKLQEPSHS